MMPMISGSLVFKAAESDKKLQLTLNGDDELRNDWKDFSSALLKHVKDALNC